MIRFYACVVIIIFSFGPSSAFPNENVYKKIINSVVKIKTDKTHGTGFYVDKNHIVTNSHLIEKYPVSSKIKIFPKDNKPFEINIENDLVYNNRIEDIAIFKVRRDGIPIKFRNRLSKPPNVGEKIFALGNPSSLNFSFTEGMIGKLFSKKGVQIIQFSAPILGGSSGSPIVDNNGELLGVCTSSLRGERNFNFAVDASYVSGGLAMANKNFKKIADLEKNCKTSKPSCDEAWMLSEILGLKHKYYQFIENSCVDNNSDLACALSSISIIERSEFEPEYAFLSYQLAKKTCSKLNKYSCAIQRTFEKEIIVGDGPLDFKGISIYLPKDYILFKSNLGSMMEDTLKDGLYFKAFPALLISKFRDEFSYRGRHIASMKESLEAGVDESQKVQTKALDVSLTIMEYTPGKESLNVLTNEGLIAFAKNKIEQSYSHDGNIKLIDFADKTNIKIQRTRFPASVSIDFNEKGRPGQEDRLLEIFVNKDTFVRLHFRSTSENKSLIEIQTKQILDSIVVNPQAEEFKIGGNNPLVTQAFVVIFFVVVIVLFFQRRHFFRDVKKASTKKRV